MHVQTGAAFHELIHLRHLHTRERSGPSGGGLSVKESEVRARSSTTGCPRPPRHTFFQARGTKRQRRQAGRPPASSTPDAATASPDSHHYRVAPAGAMTTLKCESHVRAA